MFEDDAYTDRALRTASEALDDRDRALARRLAYGAVQRVRTLDHAIETLARRPVARLDPPVRAALRLGAYQLGYMDGVPRYAAVNESVELVRRARLERAVPFTNAVLRRLGEGIGAPAGFAPRGPLKHSYPDWVRDVWRRDLGEEGALALMRAQNEPAETVVRLVRGNPPGEPTEVPGAYRVERVDERAVSEGRVWPQSRGSQLAGLAVASRAGERVLDLCAAPGGKATMLAGEVVAVEINEGRARELEENVRRLGASGVTVVQADGRALPPGLTGFDRALVDAPCSGLGVLAARPDLRWRAAPLPSCSASCSWRRRRGSGRAARSSTRSARSTWTSRRPSSTPRASTSTRRSADEWPAFRHRSARSSCRRCRTCTAPPASSSPACVVPPGARCGAMRLVIAIPAGNDSCAQGHWTVLGWDEWGGALWSSRRSTPRTSPASASSSRRCSRWAAASSISTSVTGTSSRP